MEDSQRVQVRHAGSHVRRQRNPQGLRHRRWRMAKDQLLQGATLHVLRERVELTFVDANAHKPETIKWAY